MDELFKYPDINLQYINKINNDLKLEAQMVSRICNISIQDHAKTSCYFTASLIQWLISDEEWIKVEPEHIKDEEIYQVIIGDEQHYLTVFKSNIVYQSFWKVYTLKREIFQDLNILLENRDWFGLTGVQIPNSADYNCSYYIPVNKYNEMNFITKLHSIT